MIYFNIIQILLFIMANSICVGGSVGTTTQRENEDIRASCGGADQAEDTNGPRKSCKCHQYPPGSGEGCKVIPCCV